MKEATKASAGCATSSRRGALLAQAPVDDDPDAVGQRGGVAEVVGHEQGRQRQGAEHVLQLAAHGRARVRVERRERLVEQQDLRVARQGARDRHALALAARQPARALVGQVRDLHAFQQLGARGRRSRRRRRRCRARSCAGRARTPGRRGRPSGARAAGRPWPRRRTRPGRRGRCARGRGAAARRWPAGPSSCRLPRARRARRSRSDAQADAELERAKGDGDVELERLHEESIL